MPRLSLLLGLTLATAASSVVSCDAPRARPPRVPEGWVVPAEPRCEHDDDAVGVDEDTAGEDEDAVGVDEDAPPCREPVVYVKLREWRPSPAVQELEAQIGAAAREP